MNRSNRDKELSDALLSSRRTTSAKRSSRLLAFGSLLILLSITLTAWPGTGGRAAYPGAFGQNVLDGQKSDLARQNHLPIPLNDRATLADLAAQLALWKSQLATQPQVNNSAPNPWQEIEEKSIRNPTQRSDGPRTYRTFRLDRARFAKLLATAPMEFSQATQARPATLVLPLADGSHQSFQVVESPIMEPALAARFPEIRTYRGQSKEDPTIATRFDWTPAGFHAIIFAPQGTVLIEPYVNGETENYIVYFQRDMPLGVFDCRVSAAEQEAAIAGSNEKSRNTFKPEVTSGATLRIYRLAVGATGEYTQTYGFGSVSGGLSAVTTTVNLVDAIYERDVAIRFVLIANETSIIYTDAATDGYTNDSVSALISQNQSKLDSIIGPANYDIGHVFDGRPSGGGFSFQGLASIGSACLDGLKARGVSITRSVAPSSVIAYYSTSHEIGHQFNATHTFNANTGNCFSARSPSTAYEPATGSTIMGYRFTCAPEDLMSSDTYFHNASLEQIVNYSTLGLGGSCPVPNSTGNNPPVIDAGPGYTIPRNTPFVLTAAGSDPDGDALTYCWEEFDLGAAAPPDTDDGSRPIFRSFAPTSSPARTFPRLSDVLSGFPTFGESLPVTTRTMNFRVTARDNRSDGGAINSAATQVNARADSGPFIVTQPASGTNWSTNSSRTVTWDVANTTLAPVGCASVKITLSTDGGTSFPIILANDTPNDGSEIVTIPGSPTSIARIKVTANGNIFFNISPGFTITGPANSTPSISGFSPTGGDVGNSVIISGANFITPSTVSFNGTPAVFTVNSTTEIVATVPAGATTGPITVTTPSGTATSAGVFTVNQPIVQFSASNYDIGEGCMAAIVTVTRSGVTTGATTIDFASSDGTASQRRDYSIASGTLNFAAGETSKTFKVPVTEDAYVEGNETLNIALTNPTAGTLGASNTATVTIIDNDTVPPTVNPIDDAGTFVCLHYHDFLAREPDAGGAAFWTDKITQCGADQACINSKRIDVSNAFYYELEFQQTGSYVYRLYRAAFGDNQPFPNPNPDPLHPGEEKKVPLYLPFMQDRARVRGGPQLAQFQLSLANAFVLRTEFTNRYATGLNGPDLVDALLGTINTDLGVNLSTQRQALIDLFNAGGPGSVLYRIADDNVATNPINNRAFIDAEYNRSFVFTQYAGYLRRNPDMAGFLFWLGQVNSAPIRDVPKQHAMVCSFITSTEYQQRFSSVVTHSNAECH